MKQRALDGPLLPLVQRLNEVRRAEPALQRLDNLRWLETENDNAHRLREGRRASCVVNLDPFAEQEGVCVVPVALGCRPRSTARDLLARPDVHVARRPQLRPARPREAPRDQGRSH